jgi:phosphonate transport system ATP-binding protein
MLKLDKLTRRFGDNLAVNNANLVIPDGQMVGIIGRSGAGKSTLLRLLNRLIDPSEGQILFGETDIAQLKGKELRAWRSDCAMIFQQFNLVGRLDVVTNVLTGRLHDMPAWRSLAQVFTPRERAFAIQALDRLGMAHTALQRAETLSGGQQQRVAIARALAQEPKILLADEPIASLDPMNAKIVMDALRDINQQDGITVICNLHTLDTARQLLRPDHRHAGRAHRVRRDAGSADHRHGARDLRRRGGRGLQRGGDLDLHPRRRG